MSFIPSTPRASRLAQLARALDSSLAGLVGVYLVVALGIALLQGPAFGHPAPGPVAVGLEDGSGLVAAS